MKHCNEPSCTNGYIHEDGFASICWRCARAAWLIELIGDLDGVADSANIKRSDLPNRASYRAARGRRHARAAYLIDRHDERSMFRALASP
jgi:hypothetical protein